MIPQADEKPTSHANCIDQPHSRYCLGPSLIALSDVGYVRFHGPRADTWFAREIPSFERQIVQSSRA